MLTEVIRNQKSCLQTLNLNHSFFSSDDTEKFLTCIVESGVCSTLKELNLESTVDFDLDASVRKFAEILDIAPVLKKCNISAQRGKRKIWVEVEYATEELLGAIVIF